MALPVPNFCFAHADDGNTLHTMLFDGTSQQAAPNSAGVADIEAIAFNPSNQVLYAADAGQLGTLNYNFADTTNGGIFTPIGTGFGSVNGASGVVPITDVDSLAFDPITNILYAVDRNPATQDRLIIIDIATGTADPDAFGTNIGYIEVTDNNPATVWDEDIDDLAIDPSDARLYAIANSGGAGDHLITLDRNTGALTDIGVLTTDDMEGLGFFNDGTLYGTTGAVSSIISDRNSLWRIDTSNANATRITNFVTDADYEAVDCLVGDPNNKSGFVFNDTNFNGTLDGGESPVAGVTIEIYRDTGIVANAIDASDTFIGSVVTDTNGMYEFDLAAIGGFLLQVDITSLPAGVSISDNIEIATFNNCNPGAAPFVDFGCNEPNNNFPSNTNPPPVPPTPTNVPPTDDPDPSPANNASNNAQPSGTLQINGLDVGVNKAVNPQSVQVGEAVTFTIVVTNPNSQTLPDVTITDNVPDLFGITNVSTTQGTVSISGNTVTVNVGTLQPQQTVTITIATETVGVGFAPATCNRVTIGNGQSNQVCPNIFPAVLPQTGESQFRTIRLLLIILVVGIAAITLFRMWHRKANH